MVAFVFIYLLLKVLVKTSVVCTRFASAAVVTVQQGAVSRHCGHVFVTRPCSRLCPTEADPTRTVDPWSSVSLGLPRWPLGKHHWSVLLQLLR